MMSIRNAHGELLEAQQASVGAAHSPRAMDVTAALRSSRSAA
jgi:hypothetical protein